MSRSWVQIDRTAIAHNVGQLRALAPRAALCAVVKANGYGHGAVEVARTALDAGAQWLAVAHAAEASPLRAAGLDAPILLLSEPVGPHELAEVIANELRVTVYSESVIDALAASRATLSLHLKVDTGMHRVGATAAVLPALARRIEAAPHLTLEALWTHNAVADEPDNAFTGRQLERFEAAVAQLRGDGIDVPLRHAANSATLLTRSDAHYEVVRPGIALYGVAPSGALAGCGDLRPALQWHSTVSHTQVVPAGEGVSYGHHRRTTVDTVVATVPVGYADGLPRRWGLTGGAVLIGGERRPILGVVTMDQVMVDCGPARAEATAAVARGDEVVLIGRQGDAVIEAGEVASATDTIAYEILTGIGARVARRYR